MKYTIDRQTWRRGGDSKESNDKFGNTYLLNPKGFMCCLGQCLLQEGISKDRLLSIEIPQDVDLNSSFVRRSFEGFLDTSLSIKAMAVNDDPSYSDKAREEELTKLFKQNNLELEFIN